MINIDEWNKKYKIFINEDVGLIIATIVVWVYLNNAIDVYKESRFEDLKSFIHPIVIIIGVSYEFFSHRQWNLRSRAKEVLSKEN